MKLPPTPKAKSITPITPIAEPTTPKVQVPRLDPPRLMAHLAHPATRPSFAQTILPDSAPPTLHTNSNVSHIVLAPQPKAAMSIVQTAGSTTSEQRQTEGATVFGSAHEQTRNASAGVVATAFGPEHSSETTNKSEQVSQALLLRQAEPQRTAIARRNSSPDLSQAELLSAPRPAYTEEAREMRIQGDVVLRIRVATDGSVTVLEVVHGLGHGLDDSARKAAAQYRFKPARRNGSPIEQILTVTVTFQLA